MGPLLPQPLIPSNAIPAITIALLVASKRRLSFRFLARRSGNSRNAAKPPTISIGRSIGGECEVNSLRTSAFAFTSVAIVSVEVAVPAMVGVTLVGEKLHVVFCGRPLHARLVAELKPLTDATVIVTTAGLPALNEPLDEERETVNAGGPGHTVTDRAAEADAALFVSPA